MDYMSYLRNMQHTKCLLEVMQGGSEGLTLRAIEAICYNKMLLTSNTDIVSIDYYNKDYISIIINKNNELYIDPSFLARMKQNIIVNYYYDGGFSPKYLLQHIELNLQ